MLLGVIGGVVRTYPSGPAEHYYTAGCNCAIEDVVGRECESIEK